MNAVVFKNDDFSIEKSDIKCFGDTYYFIKDSNGCWVGLIIFCEEGVKVIPVTHHEDIAL